MALISLNLEQPTIRADYESNAPTGASLSDIKSMEQFFTGLRTHTGQTVTPEKAKRCSVVLACMRGISEDLASLPIELLKQTTNGEVVALEHPVHRILNIAPNDVMTPMELREHMIFDMMLHGAFYNLKNDDPDSPGTLSSVWPLQAGYVTRLSQQLVWSYSDPLTGMSGSFTPDYVWRGSNMAGNGLDGVALTLLAREAIGLLMASEEQAARLFSHGIQSDFALSTDDTLDEDSRNQLRQALLSRHGGSGNAWMPMIFEGGLKASRIGLTAVESQYIEARRYQTEDISRVFRYPEVLLGGAAGGKTSSYASAEQFFMSYTKHTLGPWATRIEQTVHRDLLTPKEQTKHRVRHNFSSLLRADRAARYASYSAGIVAGFFSPADARREEGLPYVPGLDYYTRPLNSATTAGADASSVADTDESARNSLPGRVASLILSKEEKTVLGKKQEPELFYTHFGGFVSELTGADAGDVAAYLDYRRSDPNRFSTEAKAAALRAIISLCKDKYHA